MKVSTIAQARRTTKAFDPARKISEEVIDDLLELLRYSPSSVNSQPWHFIVSSSEDGKARIAEVLQGNFAYNAAKVRDASHVIVVCARTDITVEHLDALLAQEDADGRFPTPDGKAAQVRSRTMYVNLHRYDHKDLQHWMEKQVYLAVGGLLLGAAIRGVDATPMEGIDPKALDLALGLRERGYTTVVLVALGYHSEQDFNASLPKSRLPAERVISRL